MNPVEENLLPPPQPPQPHRISTSCPRHPDEHFTGFCPSCLFERLSVLDQSSSAAVPATAARKSASYALKSIFRPNGTTDRPTFRTRPGSFLPELRRTKSFSGGKNDAAAALLSSSFEPQRKSCANAELKSSSPDGGIVIELNDDDEEIKEEEVAEEPIGCEIEEVVEEGEPISNPNLCSEEQLGDPEADLKPMKYHIDLDSQNKKASRSFWSAASVFSKKLRSWTRKNNNSKKNCGGRTVQVMSKKSNAGRSYRETQSEVADYGFGRRSCDTDPRFSIDAGRMSLDYGRMSLDCGRMSVDCGRMSVDDPRYSFDEPRASWDGYLIGGGRTNGHGGLSRMNPMVSVVEEASVHAHHQAVMRKDNEIPLEEPRKSVNELNEECVPGGAAQTKDYYLDSSSRRKSFERSGSIRRTAAAVVAEMDEMKSVACNAKVDPAAVEGDREWRELNPSLIRDDCSESFDMGFRDSGSVVDCNGDRKGAKKSRSWRSWNIWGMMLRRGGNKYEDDDTYSRGNGVERSFSESWQELGRDGYGGDPRGGFGRNVLRSNSSVSWRNSNGVGVGGPLGGSLRRNGVETNGHAKKKSNEFVLERNRSARYSPSHAADNGLLRFYLTPMRGSRRGATAKAKPAAYSHTIARTMLRLY